ncbi:MAG: hypothetical protein KQA36_01960 [Candidatus Aenigmarchaeota archaeon]|nr:hypothetical protein [Candidatus Aenigmarchaeota archaeon]
MHELGHALGVNKKNIFGKEDYNYFPKWCVMNEPREENTLRSEIGYSPKAWEMMYLRYYAIPHS